MYTLDTLPFKRVIFKLTETDVLVAVDEGGGREVERKSDVVGEDRRVAALVNSELDGSGYQALRVSEICCFALVDAV